MGYQWATIDANFDRSLQFTKVRWDLSQSWNDGFFSELPNINCDNKGWTSITGAEWGYAGQYTMNLSAKKCFIRNQSTGNYTLYDMYAISTQVDTNIYEYEYSVPLYWGGVSNSSLYSRTGGLGISVLVQSSTFEIAPTESAATYESGTTTITINTDNDSTITWTASTNDSWLSLSTLTGAGDGSVIVTYTGNKAFQSRTGTVTFTSNDGEVLTFTVEQEKKPAIVYDRPIYRSGSLVKKMYRSGNLIYQRLNPVEGESGYYLTFEVYSGGTIVWKKNYADAPTRTIQYSLNNGNWVSITASDTTGTAINVTEGDIIQIKGTNNSYATDSYNFCNFGGTAKYYAYGNVMSLIYGDDFIGKKTIEAGYAFAGLFSNASGMMEHNTYELVLPATALALGCYHSMFRNNPSLRRAPKLPATVLVGSCYRQMFYNCTSLNYIKCLATDISADYCLTQWVLYVASTGIFAKNPNMSDWPTGATGIPTNWTVVNA